MINTMELIKVCDANECIEMLVDGENVADFYPNDLEDGSADLYTVENTAELIEMLEHSQVISVDMSAYGNLRICAELL